MSQEKCFCSGDGAKWERGTVAGAAMGSDRFGASMRKSRIEADDCFERVF
jgi:hypothetical protein